MKEETLKSTLDYREMECPKCKTCYYGSIETKYLPLIQVPSYAEFQPAEKLSLCKVCGFYGKHKLEMLQKHTVGNMQFWSNEELEARGKKLNGR